MKIKEIMVKNVLSFCEESFKESETIKLESFNLFIGKNNSGKTNITKSLKILERVVKNITMGDNNKSVMRYPILSTDDIQNFEDWFFDQNINNKILFQFSLQIEESDFLLKNFIEDNKNIMKEEPVIFMLRLKKGYPKDMQIGGFIEFDDLNKKYYINIEEIKIPNDHSAYNKNPYLFNSKNNYVLHLTTEFKEDVYHISAIPISSWDNMLTNINKSLVQFFKVFYENLYKDLILNIPAVRKIDPGSSTIKTLFDLRDGREKNKWDIIKNILKDLIFENEVNKTFDVVFPKYQSNETMRYLEIEIDGRMLPLNFYGSSVEQIIELIAKILVFGKNKIITVEEPETHLHPELQRKFIKYLKEINNDLNNQYIITSHSNVFIDDFLKIKGNVYHVYSEDKKIGDNKYKYTKVSPIYSDNISKIFSDLGVRGSDLLQANGIILVEGPSDRIYLNKWIELYCNKHKSDLKEYFPNEGKDYQIFPYGGSILKYLGFEEDALREESNIGEKQLINILNINKNLLMVFDKKGSLKSKVIDNIKKICEDKKLIFWQTEQDQIEDYLPQRIVKKIFNKKEFTVNYKDNKIKESLEIINELKEDDLNVFDLEDRIKVVIEEIKKWNI